MRGVESAGFFDQMLPTLESILAMLPPAGTGPAGVAWNCGQRLRILRTMARTTSRLSSAAPAAAPATVSRSVRHPSSSLT